MKIQIKKIIVTIVLLASGCGEFKTKGDQLDYLLLLNWLNNRSENTTEVTISGTISGLVGTIVLQNNGSDDLSASSDGSFKFSTLTVSGSSYSVTIKTKPVGQTCSVNNGSGTASANITNISINCISIVPTPIFSLTGGTYNADQSLAVTNTTNGVTIYYTLDGSTPTRGSLLYSSPIVITGHGTTKTIKAFAVKSGYIDSSIASATFIINYNAVAQPTFFPIAGSYVTTQNVIISSSTTGVTIRYTTDGTNPTCAIGTLYTASVSIASSATIKAIACKNGMLDSSVNIASYTIEKLNLVSSNPSNNQTDVSVQQKIVLTFDRNLDCNVVPLNSLTCNGNAIGMTKQCLSQSLTYTANTDYPYFQNCVFSVSGVMGLDGSSLANQIQINFKTTDKMVYTPIASLEYPSILPPGYISYALNPQSGVYLAAVKNGSSSSSFFQESGHPYATRGGFFSDGNVTTTTTLKFSETGLDKTKNFNLSVKNSSAAANPCYSGGYIQFLDKNFVVLGTIYLTPCRGLGSMNNLTLPSGAIEYIRITSSDWASAVRIWQ